MALFPTNLHFLHCSSKRQARKRVCENFSNEINDLGAISAPPKKQKPF